MIRRFVYDAASDSVVEVSTVRHERSADEVYRDERLAYDDQFNRHASQRAGERLTQSALLQAERREWAVKRFGNEKRWAE